MKELMVISFHEQTLQTLFMRGRAQILFLFTKFINHV